MKMMSILFYFMCLVISSIGHIVDGHTILKEDFELDRQFNRIHKSPIKSIQTESKHIIDCIDINKQPAFDHPLLRNHTLQQKPSSETSVKISPIKFISELEKVECPEGTVPIQIMAKNNLFQNKSLFNNHILDQNSFHTYSVQAYLRGGSNYGISGITNVYNPKVSNGQTSGSGLYITNGGGDNTNKIILGWHVHPQLYKDDGTHIFSLWTSNNFKSGCYNAMCRGFVQTDRSYYLGSRLKYTSIYGDPKVYELPVSIFQDEKTQNWWVSVIDKTIGYFPAQLFSNLKVGIEVGWGGFTLNDDAGAGASDPPMGSGHLPDGILTHSTYFRHIKYLNDKRQDYCPLFRQVETFNNAPRKCYNVKYYGDRGEPVACFLLFGGPGGACDKLL